MNSPRRRDLPQELHDRERLMRVAMRSLVGLFPKGTGLTLLAYDHGDGGHMSYVSNSDRADMIPALRDQADRLEIGSADTAGRGEA